MRYIALACDYDGTLARDGHVEPATIAALEAVRASGRRLLLVSGRELEDLFSVFTRADLFDLMVVENGALVYDPQRRTERRIGEAPPPEFTAELRRRGVTPLSTGSVIVATREPHETTVLDVIREMGLELQVIFNKGAVMVLPSGVNKGVGLEAALRDLQVPPARCVGIGDAENDHHFLSICGFSVAVANALPAVKQRADLVTRGSHGAGVREAIELLLRDQLKAQSKTLTTDLHG